MKFTGLFTTALVAIIGFAAVTDAAPSPISPSDLKLNKRAGSADVVLRGISLDIENINTKSASGKANARDVQIVFQNNIKIFRDQCGADMSLCPMPAGTGAVGLIVQLLNNILTTVLSLILRLSVAQDGARAIQTGFQLVQLMTEATKDVIPTLLFSTLARLFDVIRQLVSSLG